jgi:hypothetical protein
MEKAIIRHDDVTISGYRMTIERERKKLQVTNEKSKINSAFFQPSNLSNKTLFTVS